MYQGLAYELENVMPQVIFTGLLDALFTAMAPDGLTTPAGAPSGNFVPVAGLTNVACNSAVQSMLGIAPTEMRGLEEVLAKAPRHVMLDGDYYALLAGWREGWQCQVTDNTGNTLTYLIMGVESDSQSTHSHVEVSEVSV